MTRLLVVLVLSVALLAQEEPRQLVRSRVEPEGAVMVGQPVRLVVDVLVTTWMTRAPELPRIEIPGAVVVLPEERALNLNVAIDGQTWFGVSRSYVIYPQQAGEFELPEVMVGIKYGGGKNSLAELPIPVVKFSATIPAEAADLGYFIPTTGFRITQRVGPEAAEFKVGDSIQRTITMAADGTFAMFLPPVTFDPEEGLAVYADPPQVEDLSGDRAGFQGGRRVESASYLIQREGEFTLPEFSLFWWDIDAGRLREAAVPAVAFTAAPNPDMRPEIAVPVIPEEPVPEPAAESWLTVARRWAIPVAALLIGLVALLLVLRRVIPAIRYRLRERRRRYEMSEASAYASLEKACRANDRSLALRLLYVWLDRAHTGPGPATLEEALGRADSEALNREAAALLAGGGSWDGSAFIEGLRKARRRIVAQGAAEASGSRLSALNPT